PRLPATRGRAPAPAPRPRRLPSSSSSCPPPSTLLGVELDYELVELAHVARRRRRQLAHVLDGAHGRAIVGRVAGALRQPDVAHLAVGRDLEAHRRDQARARDDVRPLRLDRVDDLLAIGDELEPHELAAPALSLAAAADRARAAVVAADAAPDALAPALRGRAVRVVRCRLLVAARAAGPGRGRLRRFGRLRRRPGWFRLRRGRLRGLGLLRLRLRRLRLLHLRLRRLGRLRFGLRLGPLPGPGTGARWTT